MKNVRVFDKSIELKDNAMLKHRPELFNEWDFGKNCELGLDIYKVTKGSRKKAWWICPLKHPFDQRISHRGNGGGCIYCANKKVLKDFNDMWTTNPTLAKLLANPEDGYEYMQSSGKKLDWKCQDCEEIVKNKTPHRINVRGFSCPSCSDGISFGEKFVYNLLKTINEDFEFEKTFGWSDSRRYDFYLPRLNMIIEVHGVQHYKDGCFKGLPLEEIIKNDAYKKEMAGDNLIEYYIVIDARESNPVHIKNSIINDKTMNSLFDLEGIDWNAIGRDSLSSFVFMACKLWEDNISVSGISEILKVSRVTVAKYLKRGNEIGLCEYTEKFKREIVQLTLLNDYIKEWTSITDASKEVGISDSSIVGVCKGVWKQAGGFRWMYKEDYDMYKDSNTTIDPYAEDVRGKVVVQLDLNGNIISQWNTARDAYKTLGKPHINGIIATCKGRVKTAGGYRWMYKEDYKKYLSGNIEIPPLVSANSVEVVQLDSNLNLINIFSSQAMAATSVGLVRSSTIASVCKGKNKTSAGFKWMYKEDYDRLISNQTNQKEIS